ncbi:RagB/SusD family protein [Russula earlei]|uniref:RagB/SusD family protein n=1 Tax=Russula earlei TaxID=71964 RepID=A0ACC0TSX8_9AGAM|nr:RagB/SusD family protein [Russula earlei]
MAGLRSDDSYISTAEGDINQVDGFIEYPTNSYVANYWQTSYFAILQCNTVLNYLNNVTDSTRKKYFEGETKFIRAHMYFNMVRLWGSVPLITTLVGYNDVTPRADSATIYNQIIADFKTAIQYLPASWDASQAARATVGAAKGMLAKVYLTQKNYAAARPLLLDLLQNPGTYQLMPSYKNIFGVSNEMNAEVMYAVRYKSNSNGLGETYTYNMDKVSGSVGFRSASDLRGSSVYVTADSIRKNVTFLTGGDYGTSYYDGGKYLDPSAPKNDAGVDFIVLRYADIVLMYAEVVNEMDGATPLTAADATNPLSRLYQLNLVRKRANPAATSLVYAYNNAAVNTQASFRTTIKAERRREFAIEDMRWYDLIRWGDAVTVMNAHFATRALTNVVLPYQVLYPVPQREIDISNHVITQNQGYH